MVQRQQAFKYEAEITDRYAFQIVAVDAALFLGENENHILLRTNNTWQCDCAVFALHSEKYAQGICSHTLALEHNLVAACR